MRKIIYGNKYWKLHDNGFIERPGLVKGSERWRVTSAVRYNNFGCIVERASLQDILDGKITGWQFKNGKQRWHVCDFDHGTNRVWMSRHSII